MKLIDFHKEWCEKGELNGESGLCGAIPIGYFKFFRLIQPTDDELKEHINEGYNYLWWAEPQGDYGWGIYNSFRQTIVLLICAMNNEL